VGPQLGPWAEVTAGSRSRSEESEGSLSSPRAEDEFGEGRSKFAEVHSSWGSTRRLAEDRDHRGELRNSGLSLSGSWGDRCGGGLSGSWGDRCDGRWADLSESIDADDWLLFSSETPSSVTSPTTTTQPSSPLRSTGLRPAFVPPKGSSCGAAADDGDVEEHEGIECDQRRCDACQMDVAVRVWQCA